MNAKVCLLCSLALAPTLASAQTATPTATATQSPTATQTPTHTPTYTPTATPTATFTPSPTLYPLQPVLTMSTATWAANRIHALVLSATNASAASASIYDGTDTTGQLLFDLRAPGHTTVVVPTTAFNPERQTTSFPWHPWPNAWVPASGHLAAVLSGPAVLTVIKQ